MAFGQRLRLAQAKHVDELVAGSRLQGCSVVVVPGVGLKSLRTSLFADDGENQGHERGDAGADDLGADLQAGP